MQQESSSGHSTTGKEREENWKRKAKIPTSLPLFPPSSVRRSIFFHKSSHPEMAAAAALLQSFATVASVQTVDGSSHLPISANNGIDNHPVRSRFKKKESYNRVVLRD
ncbi:hypothetical protein OsJ_08542 [Oryza sativa Japonica Group]|jgi:hypothetical protein|uniref:Uncharacterized protein n=1 Tax=Oryza sativa subsp. japonica TaxID=39947 RepID=A3ABT0_ORYSJ|nr:hypothetical protein OsJ_08542 [Oryza sativa Japonica Group]